MKRKHAVALILMVGVLPCGVPLVSADEMQAAPVVAPPRAATFGADSFLGRGNAYEHRAVRLGMPGKATFAALNQRRAEQLKNGQPLEIGFPRDVARSRIDLNGLAWESLGDGSQVARLTLTSTGAVALRAALRLRSTGRFGGDPASLTLRFAGSDGRVFAENGSAFATQGWSPVVAGDTVSVEILLPKGQRADSFTLDVPQLSHLDIDPAASTRDIARATGIGASESCQNDIVCRVSPSPGFVSAARAVARMVYTSGGGSYLCTGTLLNNHNVPKRQLFWSAAHCISTQTVADTLQTYWFFDASQCDNDTASPNAVTLSGGAYLRHANQTRDTALLELKQTPPSGAYYAAWNSSPIAATGTALEGIHHPSGDLKKYSLGSIDALSSSIDGRTPLTRVIWNDGVTEGGSSGSALFTINASGDYELRGGLYGGTSYCTTRRIRGRLYGPQSPDYYSRLDGVWSSISSYFYP